MKKRPQTETGRLPYEETKLRVIKKLQLLIKKNFVEHFERL